MLRDDSLCLILKLLETTEYTNSKGETQEDSKQRNMHCVCLCEPQTKKQFKVKFCYSLNANLFSRTC